MFKKRVYISLVSDLIADLYALFHYKLGDASILPPDSPQLGPFTFCCLTEMIFTWGKNLICQLGREASRKECLVTLACLSPWSAWENLLMDLADAETNVSWDLVIPVGSGFQKTVILEAHYCSICDLRVATIENVTASYNPCWLPPGQWCDSTLCVGITPKKCQICIALYFYFSFCCQVWRCLVMKMISEICYYNNNVTTSHSEFRPF